MNTEEATEILRDSAAPESTDSTSAASNDGDNSTVDDSTEFVPRRSGFGYTIAAFLIALLALGSGLGIGYLLWGEAITISGVMPVVQARTVDAIPAQTNADPASITEPVARPTLGPALPPAQYIVNLPESYALPVPYGSLGPQLVESGAIDLAAFTVLYAKSGMPLAPEQEAILTKGSDDPIVIDRANAHFLLNFFWAVGLANRNPILLEGEIQANGPDQVENYASTGGWTLSTKPIMDIFASVPLIDLTGEQQRRLQTVAEAVYRPCCGNSTAFPDCNHGMAMLGILELMAANDASEDQMFEAAKYINAFWFPNEMVEAAAYFKITQDQDFTAIDPRMIVSQSIFSSTGAQSIKQWLADAGRSGQPLESGGGCGV